ncbi:MAG: hypothetical protein V2J08_00340 [Desulfotignum sp.]|jgi:hypothetical protein|nr:hypothetical protein [Desulfotignum sp.]
MTALQIKSPWTMVWSEYIDEFISFIKASLPSDHKLQSHDLYPGIKINGKSIFIVDDDTTGESVLMDFEKTNKKEPVIKIFENDDEIQSMIEQDHQKELEE